MSTKRMLWVSPEGESFVISLSGFLKMRGFVVLLKRLTSFTIHHMEAFQMLAHAINVFSRTSKISINSLLMQYKLGSSSKIIILLGLYPRCKTYLLLEHWALTKLFYSSSLPLLLLSDISSSKHSFCYPLRLFSAALPWMSSLPTTKLVLNSTSNLNNNTGEDNRNPLGKWEEDEIDRLIAGIKLRGFDDWHGIAGLVGTRDSRSCRKKYLLLKSKEGSNPSLDSTRRVTNRNPELLANTLEENNMKVRSPTRVARSIENITKVPSKQNVTTLNEKSSSSSSSTRLIRNLWTPGEDMLLKSGVDQYGETRWKGKSFIYSAVSLYSSSLASKTIV